MEEEFDCSKDEVISYYKPSSLLSIGLKPSQKEGEYIDDTNEVVSFDPSVYDKGPSCLLIRKDYMQKILKESGLRLAWVVQGEKQMLGNNLDQQPRLSHNVGGLFYMDDKGTVSGKFKSFVTEHDSSTDVGVR